MGRLGNLVENINKKFGKSKDFDSEKMADPKFIEFMGKAYKDIHEIDPKEDAAELNKRYEIYKADEKVFDRFDKIYGKQLAGGAEVESDTRQKFVREFLDKQIEDNPESILELERKLEVFDDSEKILESQRKEVKKYEKHGGAAGLKEKLDLLKKASKSKTWVKRFFAEKPDESAAKLKEDYKISLDKVDSEIENVTFMLQSAEFSEKQIGMMKKELAEVRTEILAGLEVAQQLAEEGRKALKQKHQTIVSDLADKPLEEIKKEVAEMRKFRDARDGRNMVFSDNEKFEEEYDELVTKLEAAAEKKLIDSVLEKITNSEISNLESELKPFMKSEGVGSKTSSDLRTKVRETMEESTKDDGLSKEKKFLLKVLLAKYEYLV